MSARVCTCRKGGWNPECPAHGRWRTAFRLSVAALFYAVVAIACVLSSGAPA